LITRCCCVRPSCVIPQYLKEKGKQAIGENIKNEGFVSFPMVRFQWSNGNFYGFNLQVDFTPDDDDGADVELPGEDGEEDDMQSFDADDLDPPGDEDRGCH